MAAICMICETWIRALLDDIGSGKHVVQVGCAEDLRADFRPALSLGRRPLPGHAPDRILCGCASQAETIPQLWSQLAPGGWLLVARSSIPPERLLQQLSPAPAYSVIDSSERLVARKQGPPA